MDTLDTKRLIIRPFVVDDVEAAHQILDVDIQWAGPGFSLERRKDQIQFHIDLAAWHDTGRHYGYRAIILKSTQRLIGICGFMPCTISAHEKSLFWPELFGQSEDNTDVTYATLEMEIGYALSNQHRGKGYAAEAVRALIQYAFSELRIRRIFAITGRRNTDSINLMKRVGMRTAANPERLDEDWPDAPGVMGVVENSL